MMRKIMTVAVATIAALTMSITAFADASKFSRVPTDYGFMEGWCGFASQQSYFIFNANTSVAKRAPKVVTEVEACDYSTGAYENGDSKSLSNTTACLVKTSTQDTSRHYTVYGSHSVIGQSDSWGEYTTKKDVGK